VSHLGWSSQRDVSHHLLRCTPVSTFIPSMFELYSLTMRELFWFHLGELKDQ
jgi:hypothetical protein